MIQAVPFELTDEQWNEARRHIWLSVEARSELNNAGSIYLTIASIRPKVVNSGIRKQLDGAAMAAMDLHKLVEEMHPETLSELMNPEHVSGSVGMRPRQDAQIRLAHHLTSLYQLHYWLTAVSSDLERQSRGRNPENFRAFIADAALIFERHALYQLFTEQPGRYKYVEALVKAVEPNSPHSIDNAVDALGTPRA